MVLWISAHMLEIIRNLKRLGPISLPNNTKRWFNLHPLHLGIIERMIYQYKCKNKHKHHPNAHIKTQITYRHVKEYQSGFIDMLYHLILKSDRRARYDFWSIIFKLSHNVMKMIHIATPLALCCKFNKEIQPGYGNIPYPTKHGL